MTEEIIPLDKLAKIYPAHPHEDPRANYGVRDGSRSAQGSATGNK
jgi:hypothetical protein